MSWEATRKGTPAKKHNYTAGLPTLALRNSRPGRISAEDKACTAFNLSYQTYVAFGPRTIVYIFGSDTAQREGIRLHHFYDREWHGLAMVNSVKAVSKNRTSITLHSG
jgi:hypothetical protein